MLNKVELIGNLGSDPEIKFLNDGTQIANFSLATSESYKDKGGNKVTNTEWHKITLFKTQAEIAGKYLKKGSKIYLEGKIKTESWDKDGVKHFATKIIGNSFLMLDSKPAQQGGETKAQETEVNSSNDVDDLPF